MSRRSVLVGKGLVLVAIVLLTASSASAGEHVRSSQPQVVASQPVVVAVARYVAPVTIRVAVTTPTEPATDTAVIELRGPDGQVRRFAVEGGPEALASRIVILRPGESLTLQLAAQK